MSRAHRSSLLEALVRCFAGVTASLVLAGASLASASVEAEIAFHRGVVAFGDERYDEARREFELVLAEDAQDTTALQYLALIADAEGNPNQAIDLYRRALEIDPDDPEIRLDLGIALLDLGELAQARDNFAQVLALQPDHTRAQLMAGIAEYRSGAYAKALPHLDKASLDSGLRTEARYYTGLCQVLLRSFELADGAFSDVEQESPVSPLGRSATQLRERMREDPTTRRWWLAMSVGMEGDSNPTVAGAVPQAERDPDGRVVLQPRAELTLYQREGSLISAGYDGSLALHFEEKDVDLQTHAVFLTGSTDIGPAQVALRYDFAATWIDLTDPFRRVHRIIPTVSFPLGNKGVTQVYYQWLHHDFSAVPTRALDRSGNQNVIGINHFFFTPRYLDYVRVGALGDFYNADGSEYTYRGWEVSAGFSAALPQKVNLVALYRYIERDYRNSSVFDSSKQRADSISRLTLDLVRPVGEHWEIALRGLFNFVDSNVPEFDYNRHVGGVYLTYLF